MLTSAFKTPSLQKSDILFNTDRVTRSFVTRGQPEKWKICHFVYKTNGKVNFFILACKLVIFPSFGFVYHSFKLNIDPN